MGMEAGSDLGLAIENKSVAGLVLESVLESVRG